MKRNKRLRRLVVGSTVAAISLAMASSVSPWVEAAPRASRQPVDEHGNPVARPVPQPKYPKGKPAQDPLPKGERRSAGTTLAEVQKQAMKAQGANAGQKGKPGATDPAVGHPIGHDHSSMMTGTSMRAAAVQGPTGLGSETGGRWSLGPVLPSPAIHSVLLNTGKVLLIAGSGNQWEGFSVGTFTSVLWDPKANTFKNIATPHDMFCAGHVILRDGRILVAGGTTGYPAYDGAGNLTRDWKGSKKSYIFDPIKEIYEPTNDMNIGRWYPTLARMGNDQVVSVAGLDEGTPDRGGLDTPVNEIFTPNAGSTWDAWQGGQWSALNSRAFPQYAHMILTKDGKLFYTGQSTANNGQPPGLWQPYSNTWRDVPGLPYRWQRNAGGSVLLPPAQDQKVMVMGGGDWALPALNDTHIVDLSAPNPAYHEGPAMANAKMYVGAVTLPDYTVLQTNGAAKFREGGVHDAQIYNPSSNAWTTVNSPSVDRLYHSSALLLPDGRVITLGSQVISGENELRMEIFEPPYLFKGQRPTIGAGPTWID